MSADHGNLIDQLFPNSSLQTAHSFIANQMQLQTVQHALQCESQKLREAESRLASCEKASEEQRLRARHESDMALRRLTDAERRAEELQHHCKQLSQRAADASREREQIRRQLRQWDNATKEVISRFDEMNAHAAQREKAHNEAIDSTRASAGVHTAAMLGTIDDMEKEVQAACEMTSSLCADGAKHVAEIEGLKKTMAMAERTIEAAEARSDELKERVDHLVGELEQARAECATARTANEELRKASAETELNLRSEISRRELVEGNAEQLVKTHDAHISTERELVGHLKAELERAQKLHLEQQSAHAQKAERAQQLEASFKAATERQAELEREVANARAELEKALLETARNAEQSERSLAELRGEVERQVEKTSRLEEAHDALKMSSAEARAADERAHGAALEEARALAASELLAARSELSAAAIEISALKAQVARVPELQKGMEATENASKEHEIKFRLEQQRASELETQLAAARAESSALVAESATLAAKLEAAMEALVQRDADAQASQATGSKAAAAAAKKQAAAEAAAVASKEEAKTALKKSRELQAALAKLETSAAAQAVANEQLEAQLAQASEQLRAQEARAKDAENKARTLDEQLSQLRSAHTKLGTEKEALIEAAAAQRLERERLGQSLAQTEMLASENARLLASKGKELDKANQSIFALEADVDSKKDEIARLKAAAAARAMAPSPALPNGTMSAVHAGGYIDAAPPSASPLLPTAINFTELAAATPSSAPWPRESHAEQTKPLSPSAPSPWTALVQGGGMTRDSDGGGAVAAAEPKSDQPTQRAGRGATVRAPKGQRVAPGKGRKPKGASAAAATSVDDMLESNAAKADHFDIFDFAGP